jgi:hypothetical protein
MEIVGIGRRWRQSKPNPLERTPGRALSTGKASPCHEGWTSDSARRRVVA